MDIFFLLITFIYLYQHGRPNSWLKEDLRFFWNNFEADETWELSRENSTTLDKKIESRVQTVVLLQFGYVSDSGRLFRKRLIDEPYSHSIFPWNGPSLFVEHWVGKNLCSKRSELWNSPVFAIFTDWVDPIYSGQKGWSYIAIIVFRRWSIYEIYLMKGLTSVPSHLIKLANKQLNQIHYNCDELLLG